MPSAENDKANCVVMLQIMVWQKSRGDEERFDYLDVSGVLGMNRILILFVLMLMFFRLTIEDRRKQPVLNFSNNCSSVKILHNLTRYPFGFISKLGIKLGI